jgi:hypothetical protein
MTRRGLAYALGVLLLCPSVATAQAAQRSPAVTTAVVRGRITAAATGRPIRGAQVVLNSANGQPQRVNRSTISNADGQYEFSAVPAQRYNVGVSKDGFVVIGRQGGRGPMDLAEGEIRDKIDFAMTRGGVIAGRVTDELGEPQAGVTMQALRYQYISGGQRQLLARESNYYSFVTNDLGQFRIFGLQPGAYLVSAKLEAWPPDTTVQTSGPTEGLATTYFPGTAAVAEAQRVDVRAAEETAASFALAAVRLSRVAGVAHNSQGGALSGARIQLQSAEGGDMGSAGATQAAADGSFVLLNVPPGKHMLTVRPMGRGAGTESAVVPITIDGADISDLVVKTSPGLAVAGHVTFVGTPPPVDGGFDVAGVAIEQSNTPGINGPGRNFGSVDRSSDRFRIPGISGRVLFRQVGLPAPWALKAVMLDGVDITDIPFDADTVREVTNLELIVIDHQPRLTGVARNSRGDVVNTYKVAVFPVKQKPGAVPHRFMYTTVPDASGRFQIPRLPPGDYVGVATSPFEPWFEWDPDFQKRVKPAAKPFSLGDSDTLTIDLPFVE